MAFIQWRHRSICNIKITASLTCPLYRFNTFICFKSTISFIETTACLCLYPLPRAREWICKLKTSFGWDLIKITGALIKLLLPQWLNMRESCLFFSNTAWRGSSIKVFKMIEFYNLIIVVYKVVLLYFVLYLLQFYRFNLFFWLQSCIKVAIEFFVNIKHFYYIFI